MKENNMYFLPISGMVLRQIRLIKNYMNRCLFIFYWPTLDILIWGFFGKWVQNSQINNMEMVLLLSILLWTVFGRIGTEIFTSMLEEFWSHNVVNVFASPITLTQWLISTIMFTIFLAPILITYLVILINLLFNISILTLLKNFFIFAPALFLAALSIGFLILSIVIYFGMRFTEIAYAIMWSFMPFSGVFYPVESLPLWAQQISYSLPMTYVFKGMRAYVLKNENPTPYLIKSCSMSLFYGIVFLILFFYMFNKSKDKGLARLTD